MKKRLTGFSGNTFCLLVAMGLVLSGCSFDYGLGTGSDKNKPDIVMDNLEYVRVRGGDPLVRFQAEHAERREAQQTMELTNFSFEQLRNRGEDINAEGRAGAASVQMDSGNISLKNGVRINVASEDVTIRTSGLDWKDKEKTLSGGSDDEVDIERTDGTSFSGRGFFADARNRTWTFSGEVKGTYVEKNDNGNGDKAVETAGAGEAEQAVKQTGAAQGKAIPPPVQTPAPVEKVPPLREEK